MEDRTLVFTRALFSRLFRPHRLSTSLSSAPIAFSELVEVVKFSGSSLVFFLRAFRAGRINRMILPRGSSRGYPAENRIP